MKWDLLWILTRTPTVTPEVWQGYKDKIAELLPDYDYYNFHWDTVQDESCNYNPEPDMSTKWRNFGRKWDDYLDILELQTAKTVQLEAATVIYTPLQEAADAAQDASIAAQANILLSAD